MGHCYLCGEDNGGGLGLCASCKDAQAERQASAPLKPVEALEVGKHSSREQHNLLVGASLCLTVSCMLFYFVFAKGSSGDKSPVVPTNLASPTSQQLSEVVLDHAKYHLTCGGAAPTSLSVTITNVSPYTANATGWPTSWTIRYGCADNRPAPPPIYFSGYIQVNAKGAFQVADLETLTDKADSTGTASSIKTRYGNELKKLQVP